MKRDSTPIGGKPLLSALLFAAISAGGLFWQTDAAQSAGRSQYCNAERGNACNDHESDSSGPSSRSGVASDPATPAEPDPPADPEPTPETPT
jgi:hypothetical protein